MHHLLVEEILDAVMELEDQEDVEVHQIMRTL
jgi:hypothetical protein